MSRNARLRRSLFPELDGEPNIGGGYIPVTAQDRSARRGARLGNPPERVAAETAAGRVKGVRAVAMGVENLGTTAAHREDADIAATVANRLDWDVCVPPGVVNIMVDKGWVTLTGMVDWRYQRDAAERNVSPLSGVLGVSNLISIRSGIDIQRLTNEIEQAPGRSCGGANDVGVIAADG